MAEKEIHQFFDRYQAATASESADDLNACYDLTEMANDVVAESGVTLPNGQQQQLVAALNVAFAQQIELLEVVWTRHRIMQIDFFENDSVADVYVRSWSDEAGTARERYTVKKLGDDWFITDFSDLSFGISTVAMAAMGLRESVKSSVTAELVFGSKQVMQCAVACSQGDVYLAAEHIDAIMGHPVAETIQGLRWQLSAAVHELIDSHVVIESVDKADAFGASAPLEDYLLGQAYTDLGRYDVALEYFQGYLNRFGHDADAYYSIGHVLEQLDRTDEAIQAYKSALADTPESVINVGALALALPDDRKSEFASYFQALPNFAESFEELGDTFIVEDDDAALETLNQVTIERDPETRHLAYYRANLRRMRGDHVASFDILADLIAKTDSDDDAREWYEPALCESAVSCGRIHQAYAICDDKTQAINELAVLPEKFVEQSIDGTETQPTIDDVKSLLAKYLQDQENSFEATYLVGNWHAEGEEYEVAREYFAKAINLANDDDDRYLAISRCVHCYARLDRAVDSYTELEPKDLVVDALENELPEGPDLETVRAMLRADQPDLFRFLLADLPMLLRNGHYQSGLDRLAVAYEKFVPTDENRWQEDVIDAYRTRFLIGLKRYDDAILSARRAFEGSSDFLRALVYAAKGDRYNFDSAYQRCLTRSATYAHDDFVNADEVPKEWLTDPPVPAADEVASEFSPWNEVRRVVFLLKEPRPFDASIVSKASRSIGEAVFQIERNQMTPDEDDYVFQCNAHAVIAATQNCKYFIHWGSKPYLFDAKLLAEESGTEGEISQRIGDHSAWLAIDIFQWPQDTEQADTVSIPCEASQRLAKYAEVLVGEFATVAIHSDNQTFVSCDRAFFEALASDSPIDAFEPADSLDR
ncbi:tetratricopeptide repeat protein [Rubripirellula tenax]|uniref:tetratricopeptide repeat protein n=1 Tax=Rubripirellula tenax TaxID=2528015 RepID=UPI001646610A|nr:tetratricopeptide repeat protein [Rubripirellula tenax]